MPDDVDTLLDALAQALVTGLDERRAALAADEAASAATARLLAEGQDALVSAQRALAKGQRDLAIGQEHLHADRLALEAERDEWRTTRATIAALVRDDAAGAVRK